MPLQGSLGAGSARGFGRNFRSALPLTYVNSVIVNGNPNTAYPSGTQNGDMVIVVSHNFAGSATAPSGFTSAFTTPGNQFSYAKNVAYKIVSGDTSVTPNGGGGFDSTIITVRNATQVLNAYQYSDANSGGSVVLSVAQSGFAIAIASDRGASGYPTISGTGFNTYNAGTATYFYQFTTWNPNYVANASVTFTDYNDVYGTAGLLFVVQ